MIRLLLTLLLSLLPTAFAHATYFDAETGLFYNHHRYYDPKTGRYLQPDPMSVAQQTQRAHARLRSVAASIGQPPIELNPYLYVAGNPLRWTDPTGQATEGALAVCVLGGPANPLCDAAVIVNVCKWVIVGGVGAYVLMSSSSDCDGGGSCPAKDPPKPDCKATKAMCIEECKHLLGAGGPMGQSAPYLKCIAECMVRNGCNG